MGTTEMPSDFPTRQVHIQASQENKTGTEANRERIEKGLLTETGEPVAESSASDLGKAASDIGKIWSTADTSADPIDKSVFSGEKTTVAEPSAGVAQDSPEGMELRLEPLLHT